MKSLIKDTRSIISEGRWDIDYHLPAEGILRYPKSRLVPVSTLADVSRATRDPSLQPEATFMYIDIASVDVQTGTIITPQELTGEEAPSRARMVVRGYDVIISTVRPTRGAICVIPPELDNQICSTGFCVLQCKGNVNPYYLHFILRLDSTLEQLRKFSTGSSYPAILDEDVSKTLVPSASPEEQDSIAKAVMSAFVKRAQLLEKAKDAFNLATSASIQLLQAANGSAIDLPASDVPLPTVATKDIHEARQQLLRASLPLFNYQDQRDSE